jgi:hypothetical protein
MINSGDLITKWITIDSSNINNELAQVKQIHTIIAERNINSEARAWIVLIKNGDYLINDNGEYELDDNDNIERDDPTYTTISLDNNGVLELNDLNTVDSISFGKVAESGELVESTETAPIQNAAVVTMLVTKSEGVN